MKQEKLDKIIIEAAESTAGGKKKKGKKGKAKGAELKAKVSTDLLKVKKDTDAVQLNDCSVKKIWTARKTLSKYKMLQVSAGGREKKGAERSDELETTVQQNGPFLGSSSSVRSSAILPNNSN